MKIYDFGLIWSSGIKQRLAYTIEKECKLRGLSFLLVTRKNARRIIEELERGRLKIRFLLDTEADYAYPKDTFARLCYAAKDSGSYVVCDPDDARQASNKAITHYDLLRANIPVPYTVVVRNWEPRSFRLSKEERQKLGVPFIIKPATGFGQHGVVKGGSIAEIAKARHYDRGDDFLLQKICNPIMLGGKQAWFRIYYLFGEIIPCWWNTETGLYAHLTLREMNNFRLLPLAKLVSEIANITKMEFFTSEISLSGEGKERKFMVIDYVNDQPDLCVHPGGKPGEGPIPEVIQHLAERIAEISWRMLGGLPLGLYRSIWLAKAILHDESI